MQAFPENRYFDLALKNCARFYSTHGISDPVLLKSLNVYCANVFITLMCLLLRKMSPGLQQLLDNARTNMNLANEQFLNDDISNLIEAIKNRQNSMDRVIRGVLEKSEPLKRQTDAKQKEIKRLHDEITAVNSGIGQYAAKLRQATESYDVASAKQKEFEVSMNTTVQNLERSLLQKNSQLHELCESAKASEAINEFSRSCLQVFGHYFGDSLTAAICRLHPQPGTEVIEFAPERSIYEIRKELWSKMA